MSWWQALVLGIVEGLTEYLPVSSTGHLILTGWLLGFGKTQDMWNAAFTFNIVIQLGAIAAVLGLYSERVKQMLLGLMGRDMAGLRLAMMLIIAVLPAVVLGPLLHAPIRDHLHRPWPVVGALFAGACLMLGVSYAQRIRHMKKIGCDLDHVTWTMALLIGFGQCIAMWPGTSRSMMAIVTALLVGMRPRAAAEFSFLLGLVTLSAATVYEAQANGAQMIAEFGVGALVWGFAAATLSAGLAVRWFVSFLTHRGLGAFGWYRLVIAVVLAVLLLAGALEETLATR